MTKDIYSDVFESLRLTNFSDTERPRLSDFIDLVETTRPLVVVEVGVLAGVSLITHALTMRLLGINGICIGIDAWELEPALEGADDHNVKLWNDLCPSFYYDVCINNIRKLELEPLVSIHRCTSDEYAAKYLAGSKEPSIDILHIDGCHAAAPVMRDARNYVPHVKPGGYVWFDDVGWTENGVDTVRPAIQHALTMCTEVSVKNGHGLYRKN